MYCPECKLKIDDDTVTTCPVCQGPLLESEGRLPGRPAEFDPEELGLLPLAEDEAQSHEESVKDLSKLWGNQDIDAEIEGVLAEAFSLEKVGEGLDKSAPELTFDQEKEDLERKFQTPGAGLNTAPEPDSELGGKGLSENATNAGPRETVAVSGESGEGNGPAGTEDGDKFSAALAEALDDFPVADETGVDESNVLVTDQSNIGSAEKLSTARNDGEKSEVDVTAAGIQFGRDEALETELPAANLDEEVAVSREMSPGAKTEVELPEAEPLGVFENKPVAEGETTTLYADPDNEVSGLDKSGTEVVSSEFDRPSKESSPPPTSRRRTMPLLMILLLVVAGAGGWFVWQQQSRVVSRPHSIVRVKKPIDMLPAPPKTATLPESSKITTTTLDRNESAKVSSTAGAAGKTVLPKAGPTPVPAKAVLDSARKKSDEAVVAVTSTATSSAAPIATADNKTIGTGPVVASPPLSEVSSSVSTPSSQAVPVKIQADESKAGKAVSESRETIIKGKKAAAKEPSKKVDKFREKARVAVAPVAVAHRTTTVEKTAVEDRNGTQNSTVVAHNQTEDTQTSATVASSRVWAQYMVHCGSFRSKERAQRQTARLQKKGFSAYPVKVDLESIGIWWRVLVKGGENREAASKVCKELARKFPREETRIIRVDGKKE